MKKINTNEDNKGVIRSLIEKISSRKRVVLFSCGAVTVLIASSILMNIDTAPKIQNIITEDIAVSTTASTNTTDTTITTNTSTSTNTSSTVDTTTDTSTTNSKTTTTLKTTKTNKTSLVTTKDNVVNTEEETTSTPVEEVDNNVSDETEDEKESAPEVDEEIFIAYKPNTYYVHMSTCRWFDSSCYKIESTDDIEARKCSECNPDIEIINPYVEPEKPSTNVNPDGGYPLGSDGLPHAALLYVTEEERIYLCNTVGAEYGSDWVSQYDKALVVAVVMNRLADGGWQGYGRANTIYNILTAPYQFNPAYAVAYYRSNVTQSCITAVDYYFENKDSFPHYTSFWGDGTRNHFS